MSIEFVMPSNHLILCHPLLLLPSVFPSIRVFINESALCIRWPQYWSFSFSISPSNEYSGLISFRMDWFDLLAVQRTPRRLLQHHRSKASILRHSAYPVQNILCREWSFKNRNWTMLTLGSNICHAFHIIQSKSHNLRLPWPALLPVWPHLLLLSPRSPRATLTFS